MVNLKFKGKPNIIYLFSALSFILLIPSFYGEDIVNARDNYLTGEGTDFWGGLSTLIYGNIPNFVFRWQIWLASLQILFTTVGLAKILSFKNQRRKQYTINIIVAYSALLFGSQMTRDGLMFSLLILGYANLKSAVTKNLSGRHLLIPLITISIAMSFRPWLSIAILPIILMALRGHKICTQKRVKILLVLILAVTPIMIETGAKQSLGLKKSYPEQQVMLMDIAATYCYSTNLETGQKAKKALSTFSNDPNFTNIACELYRPDTWVSLTQAINASSEGYEVEFGLIQVGDKTQYDLLKSSWIHIIVSDPVSYLQNKTLFATKLIIGSDSRNISIFSAKTTSEKMMAFYRIPYDIAISLHFYSLIALMMILSILPIKRYLQKKSAGLVIDRLTIDLLSAIFLWMALSAIAYIGSNGRYTYALTILSLVIFASHISDRKVLRGKNG